ncbi:MAG TPA: hypothetical protein VJ730_06940 [Nitrososphaera sp.]|nr:hypothetical protein [Nitrososphaera sp.]
MVNKFLIAIIAIVAVMVALVALPRIGSLPAELQQDLSIDYSRQNLTRIEDGRLVAASAENLMIGNDRSAVYHNLTGAQGEKQFTISSEEMNSLKGLIIATGFIQVEEADYPQKDGLDNLTRYTLKLTSGSNSKTISWVNLDASEAGVPAIVRNIGAQLDAIIERHV